MIYYYWDTMEFYRHPAKPVHFVKLLLYFYEIMTALFAVLFLFYAPQIWTSLAPFHEHPILICVTFIVIYTGMEGLYQLRWKEYFVENWYFIRTLRSDIEGYYWSEWKAWFKFSEQFLELRMLLKLSEKGSFRKLQLAKSRLVKRKDKR